MNNSDLEAKLRAAREPVLPADYQNAFPQTVLKNLRSSPREQAQGERAPRKRAKSWQPWLPRLAWVTATTVCILIAFAIGHWRGQMDAKANPDVLANAKFVKETLAMFPNQVRAIVRDKHGLNLVLSDKDNIPTSTPIYVRICNGKSCTSLVTFSGQEIQIDGHTLTVLSQANGGIIVEGNRFVWSSSEPVHAAQQFKIEAKNLSAAML